MTSKKRKDWHRADIVAELHKRKLSLAGLGRAAGLSSSTVKNALDKKYLEGMRIIADALETTPEQIWPSRFEDEDFFDVRGRN